jgi:hypothetical protein
MHERIPPTIHGHLLPRLLALADRRVQESTGRDSRAQEQTRCQIKTQRFLYFCEGRMLESILTIIALLLSGAVVGVGVIIAVFWFSVDKD